MSDADFVIDGWRVDVSAHQITRGDSTRRLERKVMLVLSELATRPDSVVSRSELLDAVWGGAFDDIARSPRVIESVHKSRPPICTQPTMNWPSFV